MANKRVLFLYSEVMPYTYDLFKELVYEHKSEIFLVYWDEFKRHPYSFDKSIFFRSINSSDIVLDSLIKEIQLFNPDIVYCSGIMDDRYLQIIKKLKLSSISVMGCDNQWTGSIKDYLKSLFSFFIYKRYFKYAWVSGYQQYEYCRRMGFKNNEIIYNLYSCPLIYTSEKLKEILNSTKKILFVGRDAKVKNIDFLVEVFSSFSDFELNGWKLVLAGSESFARFKNINGINVYPFLDSTELVKLAKECDVFILPSLNEPWGVVVHEFCSKGLILLLSEKVGAKDLFLIQGYNGFAFNPFDKENLRNKLEILFKMNEKQVIDMKNNSKNISNRISIPIGAASLLSVLYSIKK